MTQPKPRPFSSLAIGDKFRLFDKEKDEELFVKTTTRCLLTNARDLQGNSWVVLPNALVIRIHNHEPA